MAVDTFCTLLELMVQFSTFWHSPFMWHISLHECISLSTSWSGFCPPSNCVSGHISTMWFMVCHWQQSQEDDCARLHLCRFAWHGTWPVQKQFSRDHMWCISTCCVLKTWSSDSRIGYNRVVDHRSRQPVLSPLHSWIDRCHVWPYWACDIQTDGQTDSCCIIVCSSKNGFSTNCLEGQSILSCYLAVITHIRGKETDHCLWWC